jgi:hypothetical protein
LLKLAKFSGRCILDKSAQWIKRQRNLLWTAVNFGFWQKPEPQKSEKSFHNGADSSQVIEV